MRVVKVVVLWREVGDLQQLAAVQERVGLQRVIDVVVGNAVVGVVAPRRDVVILEALKASGG